MPRTLHILLIFLVASTLNLKLETLNSFAQTVQDCPGAIGLCQSIYTETNSYMGTGTISGEINPAFSCLTSGEKNDVWYIFKVQSGGDISFIITPNLGTDDYDWAVYDLTSNTCADIKTTSAMEVSCNYSVTPGNTGPNGGSAQTCQDSSGTPFNATIPVNAGDIYVVNVSQFSPSPNGYTINFSASTASIFDALPPAITSVQTPISCGDATLTFTFSENVLCNTIENADFQLNGPGGPYTLSNLTGDTCAGGGTEESSFTIDVSPPILASGNYSLCLVSGSGSVTDLCGNVASAACLPFTMIEIIITITKTDIICFGSTNGTATASVSGGNPPFTYSWNTIPVQTGITATGLAGGSYTVTVTDADGCYDTESVTIAEPTVQVSTIPVSCDSLTCDATATATPVGGTAPYTYLWDDPLAQTTATATGLCIGQHCVLVTDANSCDTTMCLTIQPPSIQISEIKPSCIGDCDGGAIATVTGAVQPYTYEWQNPLGTPIPGETDSAISNVCAGTYYLEVNTGTSCILIDSITIIDPLLLTSSITNSKNTCFGLCDGTATATPLGGTPPYTYSWSDPDSQATPTATGLCIGSYTVIITDSKGCGPDTLSIAITEADSMSLSIVVFHTNCDTPDGSATVTVSGGSTPYTYLWDDPGSSTTPNISGLGAGNYNVIVTDSIGCKDTATASLGYLDSNIATITIDVAISCNGICDGEASVNITGGTPPYTYAWSTKATTPTTDSLCADTLTVTATDSTGCPAFANIVVIEPLPITIDTITAIDVTSCGANNGEASAAASGGTLPHTYQWDDLDSQTTTTATGLPKGTYNVTVTDANGCPPANSSIVINEPPLIATATNTQVSCNGGNDGTATVTPSGGINPYSYLWDPGSQTTAAVTGLIAGTYTVSVTDPNGCDTTASVVVTQPPPLVLSIAKLCGGTAGTEGGTDLTVTGGTSPYSYSWSNGATTEDISNLTADTYTVTVTDANNCPPANTSILVVCKIDPPNAFTPNGNGVNDTWEIENLSFYPDATVKVFNRYGDLVFNSKGYDTPWDGKILGIRMPTAVYYYVISIESIDQTYQGFVTIVK